MTQIIKADGTREAFDRNKLLSSLERSGTDKKIAETITKQIEQTIGDGDTTTDIYEKAYTMLRETDWPSRAARYSLRRAILELGPSGFPFEQFIAEILSAKGYATKQGIMLKGKCIEHEIDVLAQKEDQDIYVEAKFHNAVGYTTDAKIALYVYARALDVRTADPRYENERQFAFWLITNTKFTSHAIAYGECVGLTMIGWNYPEKGNFQDLVEETGLHPVSALSTLSKKQKKVLFDNNIVLCRSVKEDPDALGLLGLDEAKHKEVTEEIAHLCVGA